MDSWNLLSSKIIESHTVDSFRRRLMQALLSREDDLSTKQTSNQAQNHLASLSIKWNYASDLQFLTKYENYVGRAIKLLDLCTNANADALTSCTIAVLHRVVTPFTLASVFADAATHAIQFVPRLACLCALAHAPAIVGMNSRPTATLRRPFV